ncbi:MAG: class I SAM-dependent methyltransferase [Marmoricola sp.]
MGHRADLAPPRRGHTERLRLLHRPSLHYRAKLNHMVRRSVIPDTGFRRCSAYGSIRDDPQRDGEDAVVRQDRRAPFAALQRARTAAFSPGEYVGQESFMCAGEIRQLAHQAGIGPGVCVLDLCCGVAGPGRLITAELGCRYLGLDHSASALEIARDLAGDLPCRFEPAHVPPLPDRRFEVVLLLETMLAFLDKRSLVGEVARALEPSGRFAFTIEEGRPLTTSERARMPDADTVWLIELAELSTVLRDAGLAVTWQRECSTAHQTRATALLSSFQADSAQIAHQIGSRALTELISAHQLWCDWLGSGRVRKFAIVAQKPVSDG